MARITTSYTSGLVPLTGTNAERYEAATIKDLLGQIKARHGKEAYKKARTMLITINKLSIQKEQHFSTRLTDGDEVGFFTLAAGG